jgi:hypothetical protein
MSERLSWIICYLQGILSPDSLSTWRGAVQFVIFLFPDANLISENPDITNSAIQNIGLIKPTSSFNQVGCNRDISILIVFILEIYKVKLRRRTPQQSWRRMQGAAATLIEIK